jgi:3-oxoacyl-[acyl-carrier-protein] synthase-3
MQELMNSGISGVGMAVPERIMTNADIEQLVETSNEWIVTRTGIKERRVSAPDETVASLGAKAAMLALENADVTADKIDLIICATTTGDFLWPATACLIQKDIGAVNAAAFDISAACSGFVYALSVADGYIRTGSMKNVLVIGADTLTKQLNWQDRNTCVLFGDGAGAVLLTPTQPGYGILSFTLGTDGGKFDVIGIRGGGTRYPLTHEGLDLKANTIVMRGSEVFKFAVKIMGDASLDALEKAHLTIKDIDLYIPHQANLRIIKAAADRMGLDENRIFLNVEKYGNTSAASIPIAMTEAVQSGRIKPGDVIVTVGFGAGLTWGANVIRWGCQNGGMA